MVITFSYLFTPQLHSSVEISEITKVFKGPSGGIRILTSSSDSW